MQDQYTTVHYHYQYFPLGIGEVDDSIVLKYPLTAGRDLERLEAERKILEAILPYKNILGFKGSTDTGIYLERAPNGTVAEYILESDLHVKLSDFQGKLLAKDSTVLVDGCSIEPYRFSLPRDNFRADVKTDLFVLGCTLYFILLGYTIFPDIGNRDKEA
ncbi:hypothetical protein C8A01DRAFT_50751 [Parachaetomium inaequale]|uniref:Protein kinase domain-containing protein n=1 Tax=Parachaetomium inaequale TaxID=2588326 RepID=A0AAN6P7X7_9PEZI|nr:hypothetical protein C8A01DRAFT_50751 [Parachaetomium inaequale]